MNKLVNIEQDGLIVLIFILLKLSGDTWHCPIPILNEAPYDPNNVR